MKMNQKALLEAIHDMDDFIGMKHAVCPPVFLLGGSGCILGGYLERATADFDIMDMDYPAHVGRYFRLLGELDVLDWTLTSLATGFEDRSHRMAEFVNMEVWILSREDIIVSKIGRFSEKDQEDIRLMMPPADRDLVLELIRNVLARNDLSSIVRARFAINAAYWLEEA